MYRQIDFSNLIANLIAATNGRRYSLRKIQLSKKNPPDEMKIQTYRASYVARARNCGGLARIFPQFLKPDRSEIAYTVLHSKCSDDCLCWRFN